MPTKKELEEELEALKRSNASLKGQITKMQEGGDLAEVVSELLDAIEASGLNAQVGQREIRKVREAL